MKMLDGKKMFAVAIFVVAAFFICTSVAVTTNWSKATDRRHHAATATMIEDHAKTMSQPKSGKAVAKPSLSKKYAFATLYYEHGQSNTKRFQWNKKTSLSKLWSFLCAFKCSNSTLPLVVLLDSAVDASTEDGIKAYGAIPRKVWHFTKLIAWSLTAYDRILFLDLDAWPVKTLDVIFEHPIPHGQAALQKTVGHWEINSGVLLLEPNLTVFGYLMSRYVLGNWSNDAPLGYGLADDQWFLAHTLKFDGLPDGFNFKYPTLEQKDFKAKEVYVMHDAMEKYPNFAAWARNKGADCFFPLFTAISTATKDYCPAVHQRPRIGWY